MITKMSTYKKYKAYLQRVIRNCKESTTLTCAKNIKNNTKRLWEIMNKILKCENNKTNIIDCLEIENIKCHEAQEIANEFGKHFSNIGKLYANKTKIPEKNIDYYISKIDQNEKSMFLSPTTVHEVGIVIDKLKNKHSSGHDNISNYLIKRLKNVIITPLSIIINKSLQEGYFPTRMKTTEVVPFAQRKRKVKQK